MENKVIKVSSPTRVDLSGGTLDCWPIYLLLGDCKTVNLSISIMTGVELRPRTDQKIVMKIDDLNYSNTFSSRDELIECKDKELTLIRPHVEYWNTSYGYELRSFSQSPVGGGLGGSSSLCISILKSFCEWQGRDMSIEEMVRLSSNIEAKILGTPTGTQDYFPAANPGLGVISYTVEGAKQEVLDVSLDWVERHMILVNTGKAHHSGINNWEVLQKAISGDSHTINCLKKIASISEDVASCCVAEKWEELPGLFKQEYKARTSLCSSFTSPEIEHLNELTLQAGADAVKICGAGGGGCVLVWSPENLKTKIENVCEENGFQVLPVCPVVPEIKG